MTVEFGPFSNFRVENPQANSADSVDCVDCYIAQPLRQFAVKNGLATTGADCASARLVPAAGAGARTRTRAVQASTNPEREMYTTVNFGYFDLAPPPTSRVPMQPWQ